MWCLVRFRTRKKYNQMEKLERPNLKETTCGIRNANLLLTGTVWLERSHGMICGAGLERSQPYPVCEMGEVTGGNQQCKKLDQEGDDQHTDST